MKSTIIADFSGYFTKFNLCKEYTLVIYYHYLLSIQKGETYMTETFRILKNEPFESLKYYQLVSTLVANHQDIEKITVIKNKKTDTFILLIVNSRDEISTKMVVLDPAGGFFFRQWLGQDFPDSEFEVFDKRHRGDSNVKVE